MAKKRNVCCFFFFEIAKLYLLTKLRSFVVAKKPFITAVRSGDKLPSVQPLQEHNHLKCTKCNMLYGFGQKLDGTTQTNKTQQKEIEKLENANKDLMENLKFYQKKVSILHYIICPYF